MLIEVTKRNVSLAVGVREVIDRRLRFALGRFSSRIRHVSVIFNDVNGNRGGCDKQCRLKINLIPQGELVLEDVDSSVDAVVANVAERAARSVARVLERSRENRGHGDQLNTLASSTNHIPAE
jgi:hypothetical protein